jgi:hypothetical protein
MLRAQAIVLHGCCNDLGFVKQGNHMPLSSILRQGMKRMPFHVLSNLQEFECSGTETQPRPVALGNASHHALEFNLQLP